MVDAAELIVVTMGVMGVSRSDLAARLGVSRPRVTTILRAEKNMSLRTFARVMGVLGYRVILDLEEVS